MMIVKKKKRKKNDLSDPITVLFGCENLIWVPNINLEHNVQADWDSL